MARTARKTAAPKRAERTASRTKQVVRLIKRSESFDTLDVVNAFVPAATFNALPAKAQNEIIKIGAGMIEVVKAGEFDLRTAMR